MSKHIMKRGQKVFVRGCDRIESGIRRPSPFVLAYVIEDACARVLVAFANSSGTATGWYAREFVRTVDEALAEQIGREVMS